MPIEPVKIPQNVQIEDRLIGPITLRQVIICLIGGGMSFVIWNMMKSVGMVTIIHFAFSWIPFVIAAAFAFIKFQNLSLLRIILLMIEKGQKPSKRTFGPREGIAINVRTYFHTEKQKQKYSIDQTRVTEDKFQHLSSVLDKESAQAQESHTETDKSELHDETGKSTPVDPKRVSVEPSAKSQPNIDGMSPSSMQSNTTVTKESSPSVP
ncbi:MAG: PrgI family protein [Patescibacteria group bacterium]